MITGLSRQSWDRWNAVFPVPPWFVSAWDGGIDQCPVNKISGMRYRSMRYRVHIAHMECGLSRVHIGGRLLRVNDIPYVTCDIMRSVGYGYSGQITPLGIVI